MVGRLCLPAHGPNPGAQRIVTFSRGLHCLLRDAEGTLQTAYVYKGAPCVCAHSCLPINSYIYTTRQVMYTNQHKLIFFATGMNP